MTGRRGRTALLLAAAAAAALLPPPAEGQVGVPRPALAPSAPEAWVAVRGRGTAAALAIVVPAGSAADAEASPGAANLLAEVLAGMVRRRLGPAVEVAARTERDWTAFTLVLPPSLWRRGVETLAATLFQDPLQDDVVAPVRDALVARFRFEEGAPVREFERELYGVLSSTASPWARAPRGQGSSVAALTPAALAAFRRAHYAAGRARVAVVGPVEPVEARASLAAAGLGVSAPPPPPRRERPWREGRRVMLPREVTNSWIGVAFPAPAAATRTSLEAVAYRVTEALNPSTPDPGIFGAEARVEDTPDGTIVLVQAAVAPESAAYWEERILDLVSDLEDPAEGAFFRWQRRRFRSAVLLAESAPEAEALRAALDLLREGRVRDLPAEIWALTPDSVADVADALGEPRIVVLGPDLSDGGR